MPVISCYLTETFSVCSEASSDSWPKVVYQLISEVIIRWMTPVAKVLASFKVDFVTVFNRRFPPFSGCVVLLGPF